MKLRIFSVVGEALNFGRRRMETIARVAWLPVALLLIVDMATIFSYLSVVAGRTLTFAEIPTYFLAQTHLATYAAQGWTNNADAMMMITAISLFFQTLLIASFMAPLIRYAGLGERPGPGVIKIAFGPDQLRYIISSIFSFLFVAVLIFLPMATATYFVLQYIVEAMSQTMASFPDPNSIHTIKLVTSGEAMIAKGVNWIFDLAVPLAAAAPFGIILWLITFLHFHPRNRPHAPERGSVIGRAVMSLLVVAALTGGAYLFLRTQILTIAQSAAGAAGEVANGLAGTPVNAILFLGIAIYLLVSYFNLRLYPYPGVAVCRKSLGLGNTLRVSRGWNIIRLQLLLVLLGVLLFIVQVFFVNALLLGYVIPSTVNIIYQAVAVSTKLVNSGVTSDWVLPTFIWIWNGIKMLFNIVWTFFSYGALAGLYGRLYRDSEREETIERGSAGPVF